MAVDNVNEFTVGISNSDADSLKEYFEIDINGKVLEALTGQKFQDMMAVLRQSWQGSDVDEFINAIEIFLEETKEKLSAYYKKVADRISSIQLDWQTFRQNNGGDMAARVGHIDSNP